MMFLSMPVDVPCKWLEITQGFAAAPPVADDRASQYPPSLAATVSIEGDNCGIFMGLVPHGGKLNRALYCNRGDVLCLKNLIVVTS